MKHRYSWVIAILVVLVSGALMGFLGSDDSAGRSPVAVPPTSESARADATRTQFPGGDQVPAILVVTRDDETPLTPADLTAVTQTFSGASEATGNVSGPPPQVSEDGEAAIVVVPLSAELSGFELTDKVKELRTKAADSLPDDLRAQVTGGPAFGADIADSFSGANFTLLAVTAAVVALLLIITYRSPVLWLVPLLVIGFADRVADRKSVV